MRRFIHWFSHGLIRYRYGFLGVCFIVSAFFAFQLRHLSFKTNLGDFYPLKHPYLKIQNRLIEIFGGLNQVYIAIEVKEADVFNPVTLDKVWNITQDLYLTEGINPNRVVSISARKVKHVEADEEGFKTEWLMHDPPKTAEEIKVLKQRVIVNPMVFGILVSKDFKACLIQADFESSVGVRKIFQILQEIKKKYEDQNHNIYISGQPVLQGWLDAYLPKMASLFILTVLAMSLVLYNAFKSKRGVLLPLLSAAMSTLWGLGITAMFGYKITPSTVLAPFLVFALGTSHAVQYIKRYYEYMSKHKRDSKAAAIKITRNLFVPAFIGLLTDGIGPFTLFFVPLGMVKSLAVAIGFGILSIFFGTIILVPNLLSFMKPPRRLEVIKEEKTTLTNRILAYFARLAVNKKSRWTVICGFFVLSFIALLGMSKLEVGDKKPGTSLLYGRSPYNQAERFISEKFATSDPYYIFVEGKEQDAILNNAVLKEMDSLQRYLEKEVKSVGRTLSIVEYMKGMNMAMFDGKRQEFCIPDSDRTIAEYMFLYSLTGFPGDFDPVVSPNYQYANIKVDLKDHRAASINEVIKRTEEWIKNNHRLKEVEFYYAGGNIGMLAAVNQIVGEQLKLNSLFVSGLVFFCLVFAYGSLVSGWLLIIPLVFRTLLVFGILGFLKVGLTAEMIPMVALGIGFGDDFGIYIVSRVKDELLEKGGDDLKGALVKAMSTSGKAVFFTGLSLSVGIAAWMLSPILMQARLGALLGFFIFFNVIGTLIVLPSMIMTVNPQFLRNIKGG
ncbi:MAG: MMPL family transporter [Candidatus Omnitrophica bacterium]|nr:MMPL family transporter [Candidatus Omnitrophota bacterium]MCM8770710.1 MMPL family transporter [Candidatus Omnitrophota bacterium]